jgi:hypothetical protein
MKKFSLLIILSCFLASVSFAQKIVPRNDSDEILPIPKLGAVTISDNEWRILTDALTAENWDKAAFYASGLLNRLKVDNDKKQMAQLRYFYLYALAGRILKFTDAKNKIQEDTAWKELNGAVKSLIGKEFVLPPRQYLGNCSQSLNYICKVKDNEKAFKVTATNKNGTGIHSFDYVLFDKKIDLKTYLDKQTFLGGTLKRVEFNDDMNKPWVMYLIFEKGFVRVIVDE